MVQHSCNESVSYVSAQRAFTFFPSSFSLKSSIEISLVLRLISENRLLSIYPTEIAVFLPSLFEFSLTKTLLSRFVALRCHQLKASALLTVDKHTFSLYLLSLFSFQGTVVGLSGLEPPTSRLSGGRSNRLSYKPIFL